jgi:trigger factor
LKIETEPRDDHQVKLTVEVDKDLLEEAKRNAARKLSRRVKIPGFRPGKAPYQVVLRQFGEAAILEDAIEILVDEVYPKVIEQAEIKPYGPGRLENIASTEPPILEFVVPLDAEVKLGDYASIQKTYQPDEVSDQDIEDAINNLQDHHAILEPVERPVEEGDIVTVTISGERKITEAGEEPILVENYEKQVLVHPEGEENEKEWPYPGFAREPLGMNIGDEKTTTYTFPEESDFENLRGAETSFTFKVKEIKTRILPEVNDEFASTVGEFENLDTLRAAIRESLELQAKDTYTEAYDEEILQEVIDQAEFKYPPQMLEDEVEQVIRNLQNRLSQQNLDMDLYLKTRAMDMDGLREEVRPTAETRLKKSLVLYELAQAEKVEVGSDEVQTETIRTLDFLTRSLSKKEAKKLSNENSVRNVMNNIMADLLARKAMERLRAIASGISPEEEPVEEQAALVESTSMVDESTSILDESTSTLDESTSTLDESTSVEETPVSSTEEPETETVNLDEQTLDAELENPESSPGTEAEIEE